MNCPRCHSAALSVQELEPHLPAWSCPQCRGHWIKGSDYWTWLQGHGPSLPEKPFSEDAAPLMPEAASALRCPDCGHILGRYAVGHEISFRLDHCAHCGGVWFDGGEWETLKARNLHDDVHAVFSDVWQARVRREAQAREREEELRATIGGDDLAELRRVKAWLLAHPERMTMYALLHPDHPL